MGDSTMEEMGYFPGDTVLARGEVIEVIPGHSTDFLSLTLCMHTGD